MYFSSHSSDKQYFSSQKIDENVVFLATTHDKSGLTRRELPCVVTRNETLSSYRNCIPLHCLFPLSLFWWPEPLRNISGCVFLFKGLRLLRTTLCAFSSFGKGKITSHNVGTKIGLIGHMAFSARSAWASRPPPLFFVKRYPGCPTSRNSVRGMIWRCAKCKTFRPQNVLQLFRHNWGI